jgi:hypothetical protein
VQAVTPDDIQRVSQAYIRPTGCRSCWSATPAFVQQLRAVGSRLRVIPIENLDLMAGGLQRTGGPRRADSSLAEPR